MTEHDGSPSGPPSEPRSPSHASPLTPPPVRDHEQVAPELIRTIEQLVDDVAGRPDHRDLARRLEWLIETLIVRGHLHRSHRKLLERIKGEASVVRLAVYADKRAVPSTDRDCASLMPLCKGRCCALEVHLSAEDLAEGRLRWDLHHPYVLRKDPDHGCCGCLGADGRRTGYADRPAVCRAYDCRNDPRVWLDFGHKLPAPMPWFLVPPEEWNRAPEGEAGGLDPTRRPPPVHSLGTNRPGC